MLDEPCSRSSNPCLASFNSPASTSASSSRQPFAQSPDKVTPRGSEHLAKASRNTPISQSSGAVSGAVETPHDNVESNVSRESAVCDPRLIGVIQMWPTLPEAVKTSIVAMVGADYHNDLCHRNAGQS